MQFSNRTYLIHCSDIPGDWRSTRQYWLPPLPLSALLDDDLASPAAGTNADDGTSDEEIDELPLNPPVEQLRDMASRVPQNWSEVPVTALTRRLALRGGAGAQTVRIIGAKRCRTIADVIMISDEQWLRFNGYSPNALAILQEELIALLATPVSSYEIEEEQHHVEQSQTVHASNEQSPAIPSLLANTNSPVTNSPVPQPSDTNGSGFTPDHDPGALASEDPSRQSRDATIVVINDWSQVPATVLIDRLAQRQGGQGDLSASGQFGNLPMKPFAKEW